MSDAKAPVPQHVSLPWAQGVWGQDAYAHASQARVPLRREPLQISQGPGGVLKETVRDRSDGLSSHEPLATADAGAMTAPVPYGAPYRPPPTIPDEERCPLCRDALVSLSVGLDVLATLTRRIAAAPPVLQDLTAALRRAGETNGIDTDGLDALLAFAQSDAGQARAYVCPKLAESTQDAVAPMVNAAESGTGPIATGSTPQSAADAIRRLEAAATLVVREARLLLEKRNDIDYRQA